MGKFVELKDGEGHRFLVHSSNIGIVFETELEEGGSEEVRVAAEINGQPTQISNTYEEVAGILADC